MIVTFLHTIGDSDPLLFRLTRDGVPAPNLATATSILITIWKLNKSSQIFVADAACVEMTGTYGAGAVKYAWAGVNWVNVPKGLAQAKVVVTFPTEIKTYPTLNSDSKMVIDFQSSAP